MNESEVFAFRAHLEMLPSEKWEKISSYLPEKTREALKSAPVISRNKPVLDGALLDHIHWSWLSEIIQSFSTKDQKLLLQILSPFQQKNIKHTLSLKGTKERLSKTAKEFLTQEILNRILPSDLLPPTYLPDSPLIGLLNIEKKRLTKLIDYLSLYDLSRELRQIVKTKILQKIYSFLKDDEKQFLKHIASHKAPYLPAHINFEKWDGEEKSLRHMLHRLGLARLGSALSGESKSFIWYVCHILDIGRGKTLEEFTKKDSHPEITKWLTGQLKDLL